MAHTISRKNWLMIIIGVLSLGGLLSYTFTHTGNLLASYVSPAIVGFLAAGGIELSIVGLSMRIGELRKAGLSSRFFWFTLVAVVLVSALANITEGFYVKYGEVLTILNIGKLDIVQAVVSIAATGLISLVTLALSEIIGQDVIMVQKASKKQEAAEAGYTVSAPVQTPVELPQPTEVPQLAAPKEESGFPYEEFKASMDSLGENAPQSISAVEKMFHISHSMAQRRLAQYRTEMEK